MNRTQTLERIAELDRQIKLKVDANRVPSLNTRNQVFPLPAWISFLVIGAIWVFGIPIAQSVGAEPVVGWLETANNYFVLPGLTALMLLVALYRTLVWIFKGRQKADAGYHSAMKEVALLQKERDLLQKQLKGSGG